jgi:hypothetical protein
MRNNDPPGFRTLRFKNARDTGHFVLAHPMAVGPHIYKVEQVPESVATSEVLRQMYHVTVLRPSRTVDYSEIAGKVVGLILR